MGVSLTPWLVQSGGLLLGLVKELRLRGISTPEAATAYVPEISAEDNERFGKATTLSPWITFAADQTRACP